MNSIASTDHLRDQLFAGFAVRWVCETKCCTWASMLMHLFVRWVAIYNRTTEKRSFICSTYLQYYLLSFECENAKCEPTNRHVHICYKWMDAFLYILLIHFAICFFCFGCFITRLCMCTRKWCLLCFIDVAENIFIEWWSVNAIHMLPIANAFSLLIRKCG